MRLAVKPDKSKLAIRARMGPSGVLRCAALRLARLAHKKERHPLRARRMTLRARIAKVLGTKGSAFLVCLLSGRLRGVRRASIASRLSSQSIQAMRPNSEPHRLADG
ncbi:hypothetical protein IE81DRAFT_350875 [Ceraceosorus guamensis]|uniref:Uncharacterized protein n=1 Tax=Ceraceosorus guamensis TaxID=1522189 RepID=A0A316VNJ7_9BASI|nr:hypothetical protein IE81DRAFT_350875 [Ceraceosorus guamensis]PWN38638.1 hypothetical protein IE81DRAFT_350875 [Ceraceosorus guamensis]